MTPRRNPDGLPRSSIAIASTLRTLRSLTRNANARRSKLQSRCPSQTNRRGTQLGSIQFVSTELANVPAIDMRAITELAEAEDPAAGAQFIAEIIDVFLSDLRQRVNTIGSQMSSNDRGGVAATAHAIKGSCGHFGATRLVDLSRDLEDKARRLPPVGLQVELESMIAEAERVRAALEAYRAEHAP
jgi:HPt (histidine-containing phosphotransfer) domain-containing protein